MFTRKDIVLVAGLVLALTGLAPAAAQIAPPRPAVLNSPAKPIGIMPLSGTAQIIFSHLSVTEKITGNKASRGRRRCCSQQNWKGWIAGLQYIQIYQLMLQ